MYPTRSSLFILNYFIAIKNRPTEWQYGDGISATKNMGHGRFLW